MNAKAVDQTPYTLANIGYQPQGDIKIKKQEKSGMTRDGMDVVDLTEDESILDSQAYHTMGQGVQPMEGSITPYEISITTRRLMQINDEERNAKWKEFAAIKEEAQVDNESCCSGGELKYTSTWERSYMRHARLLFILGIVITLLLVIIPAAMLPGINNSNDRLIAMLFLMSAIIPFGLTIMLGWQCIFRARDTMFAKATTSITIFADKREVIYDMYRYLNNTLVKKQPNSYYTSKDAKGFCREKIDKWFKAYGITVEIAQLSQEDTLNFHQLLVSHQAVYSDLIINHNATWIDNEAIMAENLKHLLCSKDEKCRTLAEKWATDFEKFGRSIFRM